VPPNPLSVDHATDVAASPEEVWALLADPSSRPSWMTELREVDAAPGQVAVGDRFNGRSSILFHDFIGASEVTEAEPGRHLAEEVVIGARFVSRWDVRPSATGAEVHHTIDVEFPAGPFSPFERWVLRRRLLRMQRQSLANLARRFSR
jgi:uncharacterized protein YndB with AHSA1/START domain